MYPMNEPKKRPVNTSAVARIVIWSVVLCILGSVFAFVMLSKAVGGGGGNLGNMTLGGYIYADPDSYTVGGGVCEGTIQEIHVDWLDGRVAIIPTDEPAVRIEEDYSGTDPDLRLRWKIHDGELTVKFCKSAVSFVGKHYAVSKNLTVYIPRAMADALEEVELAVVDSDMAFTGRTQQLDVDGTNGSLTVNGHVGELNVDLVDGELDYTGTLGHGDLDGVDFTATMHLEAANRLDIDGVDHQVTLYLADTVTGFHIKREALGGNAVVEGFDNVTVPGKGERRWGDGSFVIDADGVDAQVTVKKTTNDG